MSSVSDSEVVEDDDDRKICQLIYDMDTDERERNENQRVSPSRDLGAFTDVTERWPGSRRRVKVHQCVSDERNNTQVVTESPKKDGITSYHLNPPSNFSSLLAYTSSPFLYHPVPPPPASVATLDRENAKESSGRPTLQYLFPSGGRASSARVNSTAPSKAWEYYIRQEQCDKDRHRSTERGHDKDSKRGRGRERASCSSHSSGEERMRHRDTMEQRHRHHNFERGTGEKEEQHRERRQKSERWQKSPRSSSGSSRSRSSRNDSEDRKSQKRH